MKEEGIESIKSIPTKEISFEDRYGLLFFVLSHINLNNFIHGSTEKKYFF